MGSGIIFSGFSTLPKGQTRTTWYFEDFIGGSNSMQGGWSTSNSGGTANTTPANTSTTEAGLLRITTGSTNSTNQRGGIATNNLGQVAVGGGCELAFAVKVAPSVLAFDGTSTGWLVCGMGTVVSSADTNAIEFRTNNGGNWFCYTTASSVSTSTDTGLAATLGTFRTLSFVVNSTGTSVKFYSGQTLIATHTTNIPTAFMGCRAIAFRSAANTNNHSMDLDWIAHGRNILAGDQIPILFS